MGTKRTDPMGDDVKLANPTTLEIVRILPGPIERV